MIISTITIISLSIGLATGLISGGALGFAIGNRRRTDRERDENYFDIIHYYPEDNDDVYIT